MTVAPILAPDPDAMGRHLRHVFAGDLADALIELSWSDPRTGALACAELFDAAALDAVVARAFALNRQPGCNVYVGAALRRAETARGRRAKDEDFCAATCAWADIDSDVVAAAVAMAKGAGAPPTMTVVTGRHPHVRAQMWWRLEEPCRDAAELRVLNGALAAFLGGDPTVVNPSRVLRLGGSVAWPTKAGRVLERTEVHVPRDGRPAAYAGGLIARAFAASPPAPLLSAMPRLAVTQGEPVSEIPPVSASSPRPAAPASLAIGSLSVEAALAAARRFVTVVVAPAGVGKTSVVMAAALAGASGRPEIFGRDISRRLRVALWNNEDDLDELRRRLAALMQHWSMGYDAVAGHLTLRTGVDRPLMVAKATKDGAVLRTPDVDAVVAEVRRHRIDLLIVDPFVETHEADENDNAQVKAVGALWREVARAGDCAVVLVHHTGKPPQASPDAWVGSLQVSRGASSLAGIARIVVTAFPMSKADAEELGLRPEARRRWVRLDDAKANLSLVADKPAWFERLSVTIANGEDVGALAPGDPTEANDSGGAEDTALDEAVLAAVEAAWQASNPLSDRPEARGRYAPFVLAPALRVSRDAVRDAIVRLQLAGRLVTDAYGPKRNRKGLRAAAYPDRSDE